MFSYNELCELIDDLQSINGDITLYFDTVLNDTQMRLNASPVNVHGIERERLLSEYMGFAITVWNLYAAEPFEV